MNLVEDIGVTFYIALDDEYTNVEILPVMEFTLPDGTVQRAECSIELNIGGTTYYGYTCHVAPKEMTAEIKAQLYNGNSSISPEYSYTVKEYADYILNHGWEYKYNEELQELVRSMLNYGAWAQRYFEYKTDQLADEGIGDMSQQMETITAEYIFETSDYEERKMTDSLEGIEYYGNSLLLEAQTVIRYYFRLSEGASIEDYEFGCDGETVSPEAKDGLYYVDTNGIPPHLGMEGRSCFVTKKESAKEDEFLSASYSVYAYIHNVLASDSQPEQLKQLVKALYLYEEASYRYAGCHQT